jgi:hypothetical protein
LLNDGKTPAKIAEYLDLSVNKVSYGGAQVEPDNLKSLRDERLKENPKKATNKYREILL